MSLYSDSKISYIVELERGVTGGEFDNNFRVLYYSSSLHDGGATLRLHRDINPTISSSFSGVANDPTTNEIYNLPDGLSYDSSGNSFDDISLAGGGTPTTINSDANNRVITATGTQNTLQAESNFLFDGSLLTLTGSISIANNTTEEAIYIGKNAGGPNGRCSVIIGTLAGANLNADKNTVVGGEALTNAGISSQNTSLGYCSLQSLTAGFGNSALGVEAGSKISSGCRNLMLGFKAGPSGSTAITDKLYINNSAGPYPLICGDFASGQLTVNSQVSASIFSGSFHGDGSNLTGISLTAFPHNGDALITGSLTVSGSGVVVNFTDAQAISGSSFSGSFFGDGSGLSGISTNAFPHDGDAVITGSLVLSGSSVTATFSGSTNIFGDLLVANSSSLQGITTIGENIKIHQPNNSSIAIGQCSMKVAGECNKDSIFIGINAGCDISSIQCRNVVIGNNAGRRVGTGGTAIGYLTLGQTNGTNNTAVGYFAMGSALSPAKCNTAIGVRALCKIRGCDNTAVGISALNSAFLSNKNTAIGCGAGRSVLSSDCNVFVGSDAGAYLQNGCGNVFIGFQGSPILSEGEQFDNKLHIGVGYGDALICGDFASCQVTFQGGVSGSFSGSFDGDGTNLTGVTAEWDGSRNGDASITGSLAVSGSTSNVDFTNVLGVSGSFSGSFVGDGSGLTGVTGTEWDGSRNGDSNITGSLIVSGALDVAGTVTIASGSFPNGPGVELIQINGASLTSNTNLYTFLIDGTTGYTGFKADYVVTDSSEGSKKVGTVYGSWDRVGNSVVNDEHTLATGQVTGTSFSIDASSGTSAIFKLNIPAGGFEINSLITAFKRVV